MNTQERRIKTEICFILREISNLPAMTVANVPKVAGDRWGVDIEAISTPEVLAELTKLKAKMEKQRKGFEESCPGERMTWGYGKPSEEEILKVLKGGE